MSSTLWWSWLIVLLASSLIYAEDCVDGAFTCNYGDPKFKKCDHSAWVTFDCAPGTLCRPYNSVILCDYASLFTSAPPPPAPPPPTPPPPTPPPTPPPPTPPPPTPPPPTPPPPTPPPPTPPPPTPPPPAFPPPAVCVTNTSFCTSAQFYKACQNNTYVTRVCFPGTACKNITATTSACQNTTATPAPGPAPAPGVPPNLVAKGPSSGSLIIGEPFVLPTNNPPSGSPFPSVNFGINGAGPVDPSNALPKTTGATNSSPPPAQASPPPTPSPPPAFTGGVSHFMSPVKGETKAKAMSVKLDAVEPPSLEVIIETL